MQVTETQTEGLKREFKVVIAANDIEEKLQHRLMELGSSVKVPGFRPGKVPVKVLKQRFGRSVLGEVVERAVTDGSSQALSERGLRPATALISLLKVTTSSAWTPMKTSTATGQLQSTKALLSQSGTPLKSTHNTTPSRRCRVTGVSCCPA